MQHIYIFDDQRKIFSCKPESDRKRTVIKENGVSDKVKEISLRETTEVGKYRLTIGKYELRRYRLNKEIKCTVDTLRLRSSVFRGFRFKLWTRVVLESERVDEKRNFVAAKGRSRNRERWKM